MNYLALFSNTVTDICNNTLVKFLAFGLDVDIS